MQIRLVRGEEYSGLIRDFKRRLKAETQRLSLSPTDAQPPPTLPSAELLSTEADDEDEDANEARPIAQYLLATTEDGSEVMGIIEAFFQDQMREGYHEMGPEALVRALEARCDFSKLAVVETVYVLPRFRRQPVYLYLYLAMSQLFRELGAQGSLCVMRDSVAALHRLYLSTGGHLIATFQDLEQGAGEGQSTMAAYYFDLETLCAHPRLQRALRNCHLDMELARDTYNWKYGPQEDEDEAEAEAEPEQP